MQQVALLSRGKMDTTAIWSSYSQLFGNVHTGYDNNRKASLKL